MCIEDLYCFNCLSYMFFLFCIFSLKLWICHVKCIYVKATHRLSSFLSGFLVVSGMDQTAMKLKHEEKFFIDTVKVFAFHQIRVLPVLLIVIKL